MLLALGTASAAFAAPPLTVPDEVSYQGVLRDASGQPLDGTYDMEFRFWSADTGGDEILIDTLDSGVGAVRMVLMPR